MRTFETITTELDAGVLTVTLNRPDRLNAFTPTMIDELAEVWVACKSDASIGCVVLTGAGDRAFCTGIDREGVPGEPDEYTFDPFTYADPGDRIGPKAHGLWKPVIAAVNGMACGGAFYLLGDVEFIVAAEHATFFDPHLSYGMAAILEPTLMAPRMPFGEIMRMSLLGNAERMSAGRAYEIGLVSEVVPGSELLAHTQELAREIAEAPTEATQATVRNLWLSREPARRSGLEVASFMLHAGNNAANLEAGQRRFLAKGRRSYRTR